MVDSDTVGPLNGHSNVSCNVYEGRAGNAICGQSSRPGEQGSVNSQSIPTATNHCFDDFLLDIELGKSGP